MELRDPANTSLTPPSNTSSSKVKRNKSLVARGISKMFGSRHKYKVDKVGKGMAAAVSDSEKNSASPDECDLKENCNEKKNKKEKSFKRHSSKRKPDKTTVDSADYNLNHDEIDLKEDQYGKKKKKKQAEKTDKFREGHTSEDSEGKSSNRKFGGLFSRSKKKDKSSS
ncbi:uncharacterized protein [Montipora foliosa]|uniref:uncharacterized protein n=1 Tax=Montipora foliosa TaxID=591990 RepID=UPI0035F1713A